MWHMALRSAGVISVFPKHSRDSVKPADRGAYQANSCGVSMFILHKRLSICMKTKAEANVATIGNVM